MPLMHKLLKKGVRWEWTGATQREFEEVKRVFLNTVILEHPNFGEPFVLQTDSSKYGLGAVLFQRRGDREGIISFVSRKLRGAELNYNVTEKECLAIVWALVKFRLYLLGARAIVETDHKALTFLLNGKLTNARLIRWALVIQEYEIEVRYIPGSLNIIADHLSRVPIHVDDEHVNRVAIESLSELLSPGFRRKLKTIGAVQKLDTRLRGFFSGSESYNRPKFMTNSGRRYYGYNGIIYQQDWKQTNQFRMCVPQILTEELIWEYHKGFGHFGARKCILMIREEFVWPKLARQVKQVVATCDLCQRAKHPNLYLKGELGGWVPDRPKQLVSVDIFGPLPKTKMHYQYILVFLDVFSRYTVLYPLTGISAKHIVKALNIYLVEEARPDCILNDNGTQFTSKLWTDTLAANNVKNMRTSIRHPQANPVERVMREIGRVLRTFCHARHSCWIKYVSKINQWLNISVSEATGYTPYELFFGRQIGTALGTIMVTPSLSQTKVPWEIKIYRAKTRLERKREERARRFRNTNTLSPTLLPGQKVWVKNNMPSRRSNCLMAKLFLLYDGPYVIARVVGNSTYEIEALDGKLKGRYSGDQLKLVVV